MRPLLRQRVAFAGPSLPRDCARRVCSAPRPVDAIQIASQVSFAVEAAEGHLIRWCVSPQSVAS